MEKLEETYLGRELLIAKVVVLRFLENRGVLVHDFRRGKGKK